LSLQVRILLDLDEHYIEESEVKDLCTALADAHPDEGSYVVSFGFLTYTIKREAESCVVEVTEGYGYHSAWGGIDGNFC